MFDIRNVQGITVIEPKGNIDIEGGDVMLRDTVTECLDSGHRNILINMAHIGEIDDSGIGELVTTYTTTSNYGGQLKLCSLPSKVHDVLQITHLITVFEVYDTVEEAVDSFL